MTAHARHIDLLLQVADIATFHDLPVPDIFHQYSGTENESTLLWVRAPDRDTGPMWAYQLGLGVGAAEDSGCTYRAIWKIDRVELNVFCNSMAEAERLIAQDVTP